MSANRIPIHAHPCTNVSVAQMIPSLSFHWLFCYRRSLTSALAAKECKQNRAATISVYNMRTNSYAYRVSSLPLGGGLLLDDLRHSLRHRTLRPRARRLCDGQAPGNRAEHLRNSDGRMSCHSLHLQILIHAPFQNRVYVHKLLIHVSKFVM